MDLIDQPSWAHAPSAPAADHPSVSENVRERETFKYVPRNTRLPPSLPPPPPYSLFSALCRQSSKLPLTTCSDSKDTMISAGPPPT
jgi:hypothetical protein